MSPLATLLLAIFGVLLTMFAAIARQDDNVEIRKILAWVLFVLITLLLPSFLIVWLTMQIAAKMIASVILELSSFTSQVAWWTSGIGMIYPVLWGVWLQPKIDSYIRKKILGIPKTRKAKTSNNTSKNQGENTK